VSLPIEIGTDEQFAALRDMLRRFDYSEQNLCRRFGIQTISQFEEIPDREQIQPWDTDGAESCSVSL
jgi:hypothetical protein